MTIVFLTEGEIKALANLARVAIKEFGHVDYIEGLLADGGKSGYDKLLEKIKELNNDSKRE